MIFPLLGRKLVLEISDSFPRPQQTALVGKSSARLGSHLGSTTCWLHVLGQVTLPLCAVASSSMQWAPFFIGFL